MVVYEKDQMMVEIAGIPFGGQPGEYPTVLIGSLFYQGHKIVQDAKIGLFDKKEANRLLSLQDNLSEQTGNPAIVDVMGFSRSMLLLCFKKSIPVSKWRVVGTAILTASTVSITSR